MLVMGISGMSLANNTGDETEKEDNYEWLIEEIDGIEDATANIQVLTEMVYIFDAEGNEIASFAADEYEKQSASVKRKVQMSTFIFETLGDQVYIMN